MGPPYVVSFVTDNFDYGGLSIAVAADMTNGTLFRFKATDTGICYEGNLEHQNQVNIFNEVSSDDGGGSFAGADETPTPTSAVGLVPGGDITPTPSDGTNLISGGPTPTPSDGVNLISGDPTPTSVPDCCDQESGWKSVVVKEGSSEDPVDSEDGVTAIGTPGKLCFADIVGYSSYPSSYLVSLETDDYSNGGCSITIQGTMSNTTFRYIKSETGVCYIGTLDKTVEQGVNVFTQE